MAKREIHKQKAKKCILLLNHKLYIFRQFN